MESPPFSNIDRRQGRRVPGVAAVLPAAPGTNFWRWLALAAGWALLAVATFWLAGAVCTAGLVGFPFTTGHSR
jgi:hypothetical protein